MALCAGYWRWKGVKMIKKEFRYALLAALWAIVAAVSKDHSALNSVAYINMIIFIILAIAWGFVGKKI